MTDRKLLELAAKAAGFRLVWGEVYQLGPDLIDCSDIPYVADESPDSAPWHWNPLEDDGDALRLAVKLGIDLITGGGRTIAYCQGLQTCEYHGDDPYAATRRAIVRAAAAIGEAKQ